MYRRWRKSSQRLNIIPEITSFLMTILLLSFPISNTGENNIRFCFRSLFLVNKLHLLNQNGDISMNSRIIYILLIYTFKYNTIWHGFFFVFESLYIVSHKCTHASFNTNCCFYGPWYKNQNLYKSKHKQIYICKWNFIFVMDQLLILCIRVCTAYIIVFTKHKKTFTGKNKYLKN